MGPPATVQQTGWFRKSLRFGFYLAVALAAYVGIVLGVLEPLHARGLGQPLTGFLNGLGHVLQVVGLRIVYDLGLRTAHHLTTGPLLISVGLNVVVAFLAGFLLRAFWHWAASLLPPRPLPVEGFSRRRFLTTGLKIAGGSAAAGFGYTWLVEPRWFSITRQVFPVRDLPSSLEGLRLVQLTDIHHGPWLSLGYVRQVVEAANQLEPDLFLLTGDYVLHSPAYILPVIGELAKLRPKIATLAVLGNHDWWEGAAIFHQEFPAAGITLIDNQRWILTPDRRLVRAAPQGLVLAGVGDLWQDHQDYRRALGDLPNQMPRLLLSHNPDVAEEADLRRSGLRIDLMLSGHTHGGQIRVPGMGTPMIPSRYGQKYAQGLVQGPVCPVFICRGVGMSVLPLRLGVSPEVAVLELRALRD
jgi:predicted MPP superfamily phosphohydrolase